MDIMEKEVFVGAKREKRGQRFFVKKRHVCSSQKFKSKRSERFLSLSLITFSLSLSFTPLFVVLLFVSSERARCAVEADTINERFYSRTFSVIIDDEIIWKKKKKKL